MLVWKHLQVAAVSQRVAQLRGTVPNQLAQQLTQHLHDCRPALIPAEGIEPATADTLAAVHDTVPSAQPTPDQGDCADGAHSMHLAAADEAEAASLSPAPAALQSMCKAAVQRMPALRYAIKLCLAFQDSAVALRLHRSKGVPVL